MGTTNSMLAKIIFPKLHDYFLANYIRIAIIF